mmetsp:Transcript_2634/g.2948  ORF Transcript_2634/g.2948 Transcript_2634/m.2948 type:complete len:411 (-) Transcript_2634:258-1490(-)|eukprot:CAMPEP_0197844030 /NCGR_PEP_ID=MMETSP1438-20131217/996_1 /TAXON_ID=1461541 /ORGANISM="Pterosperma sp., Strain CCMP1384" /LENGTH=410 /DNA_ID=CAMNT_0043454561 /DNA_START=336 /DNA_END=1568 /DNA_ORIENTATION=-
MAQQLSFSQLKTRTSLSRSQCDLRGVTKLDRISRQCPRAQERNRCRGLSISMQMPEFSRSARTQALSYENPSIDTSSLVRYTRSQEEPVEGGGGEHDVVLFCSKDFEELGHTIASTSDHITVGSINWGKFGDGFPNLFVRDARSLRNKHVAFLASFHEPGVIFEQLGIIHALPRMFVASFTVVLPFFPTGTSERIEDEGEIATAYTLARILSDIPPSRGGPTSLVIYDIHALQERFYFGDQVLPYFQSAIPILKKRLKSLPDADLITIAYPDEGAWKRFHNQFKSFPEVVCTKVRDGDKRIVRLKEGQPHGRHVVIVDDLVQSGGTIIETQKLLAAVGAKHVSAFATHGVFPNRSFDKFVPETREGGAASGFAHFWITDSCPQTVKEIGKFRAPFEILSLANSVAACLIE